MTMINDNNTETQPAFESQKDGQRHFALISFMPSLSYASDFCIAFCCVQQRQRRCIDILVTVKKPQSTWPLWHSIIIKFMCKHLPGNYSLICMRRLPTAVSGFYFGTKLDMFIHGS